jgi:hypothetical protein
LEIADKGSGVVCEPEEVIGDVEGGNGEGLHGSGDSWHDGCASPLVGGGC